MLERLQRKGFAPAQIDGVMNFLEDTGLINDQALSSDLFQYSIETKSLGKNGIRMFLFKRGFHKGLIDKTLMDHTREMEEKAAREFAERKMDLYKNYSRDIVKRRIWGMLQRRGFSYEVIKDVVGSLFSP